MGTRLPLLQKPREGKGRRQRSPTTEGISPAKITETTGEMTPNSKQQWEEEMERLHEKYNLDCFLSSKLDSESDEGEQYHYKHGYETLI